MTLCGSPEYYGHCQNFVTVLEAFLAITFDYLAVVLVELSSMFFFTSQGQEKTEGLFERGRIQS